jgi:hypothetical protein
MSIFEGAVSGLTGVADKLGFNFLTGNIPVVPPGIVYVGLQVDSYNDGVGSTGGRSHVGGFALNVPNHSAEFGDLAIQMAQEALVLIELAVALQTISDPKGGIRIKDALDPYHFNVVKNALVENEEPVPAPANPGATLLSKLGGSITETGALSAIVSGAQAMKVAGYFSDFLKFTPQFSTQPAGLFGIGFLGGGIALTGGVPGQPITSSVAGAFPSYSLPLNIMSAAVTMKTIALQYIVSLLRNSIDTVAGAVLLKNVLDDFSVAVSSNAIAKAGGTPPEPTVQEGQTGIF